MRFINHCRAAVLPLAVFCLAAACFQAPAPRQPSGPTRSLVGAVKSEAGVDFSKLLAVFLTRGGAYSAAPVDSGGGFAIVIPALDASGALVLADYVSDPTQLVTFAPLVDSGTGEGLVFLEGGTDDLTLTSLLDVDVPARTMSFVGSVPDGVAFSPGAYSVAELCSDTLAAGCPLSDVMGCGVACVLSPPQGSVLNACSPCTSPPVYLGPFHFPQATLSDASLDKTQDPLPDVVAPFPGLALVDIAVQIPPVTQGGVTYPAVDVDLGLLDPTLFRTDPDDRYSYRFVFEDGERFSVDDFFSLAVPVIPAGAEDKIVVIYRTTLGDLTAYRCAPDNTDPGC